MQLSVPVSNAVLQLLCYAMLCYAMLCYAMLCYATLRYAMLCCSVLCCAMLICSFFVAEMTHNSDRSVLDLDHTAKIAHIGFRVFACRQHMVAAT